MRLRWRKRVFVGEGQFDIASYYSVLCEEISPTSYLSIQCEVTNREIDLNNYLTPLHSGEQILLNVTVSAWMILILKP